MPGYTDSMWVTSHTCISCFHTDTSHMNNLMIHFLGEGGG